MHVALPIFLLQRRFLRREQHPECIRKRLCAQSCTEELLGKVGTMNGLRGSKSAARLVEIRLVLVRLPPVPSLHYRRHVLPVYSTHFAM